MARIFVKPASEKVKVRHPETLQHIPADGAYIAAGPLAARLLASGDIIKAKPVKPAKQTKTKATAEADK